PAPATSRVRSEPTPPTRRLRDPARDAGAPLPPLCAPAPERRRRGMGAGTRRRRDRSGACARTRAPRRRRRTHAPARRIATLARHVLRLARPVDLRHRARTSELALAPRACDLFRRRRPDVVAGRTRPLARRRQGAVPLRSIRAGVAAGSTPRAAPPPCVLL